MLRAKDGAPSLCDDAESDSQNMRWQEANSQNMYWQEALQVYDKLLGMDLPAKYRESSLLMMIHLCRHLGRYDKAKALANEQPSIILSKEILLTLTTTGEESDKYHGELILALLGELSGVISRSVLTNPAISSTEYGREVLLTLVNLFETVLTDGRCGNQHTNLRYLYLTLATLEARHGNNPTQALSYFDKGFEHHREHCRISVLGDYRYSAPLVANVTLPADQFQPNPEHFWKLYMPQFSEDFQEELKKNEKFKECFE